MWANAMLLLVTAICVVTDLKSRRIYNIVIFPSLAIAFAIHTVLDGWFGAAHAVLGFAVGLSILLIPYLLGGMGAGDVKLLALVGALKGTSFVLIAAVYMALFGGVMALLVILFSAGAKERLRFFYYALICFRFGHRVSLRGGLASSVTYPYGVAIAGGAALGLVLKGWGAG